MKIAHPIHLLAAILAGACLLAAHDAEASSTNVNANADEIALSCSWNPDYAKAPGSFTFVATVTCDGNYPPDPTHDATIDAGVYGNITGVNQVTLTVTNVAPGMLTVVFSGGGETHSATVYSLKVDIVQELEEFCNHYADYGKLNLTADSYLGPFTNAWYWDGEYIDKGNSYSIPPPSLLTPCSAKVLAAALGFSACCDTCTVNIVKADLTAEGCVGVTNGPGQTAERKQMTINKCEPADWDGSVELLWTAGKVKVYTASTGGDEVTSGQTYANKDLPKNLWVEGTAAGDVIFRLNPVLDEHPCPNAADGCDQGEMTVLKVAINGFSLSPTWARGNGCTAALHRSTCQASIQPEGVSAIAYSIQGAAHGATIDADTGVITPGINDSGTITVRAAASAHQSVYAESNLVIRAVPTSWQSSSVNGWTPAGDYGGQWTHTFSSSGGSLNGVYISETVLTRSNNPFGYSFSVTPGPPNVWTLNSIGIMTTPDNYSTSSTYIDASEFLPSPPKPGLPQTGIDDQWYHWWCSLENTWVLFSGSQTINVTLLYVGTNLIVRTSAYGQHEDDVYTGP